MKYENLDYLMNWLDGGVVVSQIGTALIASGGCKNVKWKKREKRNGTNFLLRGVKNVKCKKNISQF